MSYGIIDTLKKAYPVSQLCEVLDVHKSGYYYWQAHRVFWSSKTGQIIKGIWLLFQLQNPLESYHQ